MQHCRLPCADVCCIHGSDCGTQLRSAIKGWISREICLCVSLPLSLSRLLSEVHLSQPAFATAWWVPTVHSHIFWKQGIGTKPPIYQSFRSLLLTVVAPQKRLRTSSAAHAFFMNMGHHTWIRCLAQQGATASLQNHQHCMTPMPACQCFQCGFFVFLLCWLPYGGRCGATTISCKQTRVTTLPQLAFQQINPMMYKAQATNNLGREEPRADQNGSLAPTFTQSMTFNLFDPNQTHLGSTLTRSTRAMRQRYPTISTLIVFFWGGGCLYGLFP